MKSSTYWAIETDWGKLNWKLIPWIGYSYCKFSFDTAKYIGWTAYDNKSYAASIKKLTLGLITPIPITLKDLILLKFGGSYNFISEEFSDMYSESYGIQINLGYTRKLTRLLSSKFEISYDYARINKSVAYRDWGGLNLNAGLALIIDFGAVNWSKIHINSPAPLPKETD
jgi:hypothetical protein